VSQMIETEACEGYDWLLDSLEKTRAGGSLAALGLAVCGPVLLTAPPKNRPILTKLAAPSKSRSQPTNLTTAHTFA
jgi:hypothetical protein